MSILNNLVRTSITITITLAMVLTSCVDTYDRDAIGKYTVTKYELLDSSLILHLPSLTLHENKTFIIEYPDKEIKGRWDITSYGDFEIIKFKSSSSAQGKVIFNKESQVLIEVETGSEGYFPEFKVIVFQKQKRRP